MNLNASKPNLLLSKRALILCLLLALPLLLSSCKTIGTTVTKGVDQAPCVAFAAIYTNQCRDLTGSETVAEIKAKGCDVLSDPTAKQILTHDLTGAKLCGWKPHHNSAGNPVKLMPANSEPQLKPP